MKILISNPILIDDERTSVSTDYSSGTSLYVDNNEGFTTNWFVIVGEPGQEKTESRKITGTSGTTIVTLYSALSFTHAKSTPVYLSQWDYISFEQKQTGGSYAEISTSPLAIEWDNDNNKTLVVVSGGVSTDYYRWRYYNSATAEYSEYSDALAGTGFTRYTAGYVLQQVKKNPLAQMVDDETMFNYMNDYQTDVVYPELPKAWWFSKEGTAVATSTTTRTFDINTNWSTLSSVRYVLYRYISGDTDITYPLTWSPTSEFYNLKSDANQAADDYAKYWTLLPPDSTATKGYIAIHPQPKTDDCYVKPVYYYELTDLNSYGDTLVVPYPKGYIDYVLYRICDDIKSDSSNAEKYNARVARSIIYLKRISRRQLGQPELFRFRGVRGWSQLFGEQSRLDSSDARELYW